MTDMIVFFSGRAGFSFRCCCLSMSPSVCLCLCLGRWAGGATGMS